MSGKSKRSHGETCACGCGRPFTDGQEMVVVGRDGTRHCHCLVCGQRFRQGQDIQTVKVAYSHGETTKLPMHLECVVHACTAHGPLGN
jgi:hypothetical protein